MSNTAPQAPQTREEYQARVRERYQKEQEGLSGERDGIRIDAPKDPEVNPEVYRDVVSMLFRGFLTVSARIGDAYFVFKSLNHHELDLLRFMGAFDSETPTYKQWDTLLAYNIFMIDGQNVLLDRDRWVPKIVETFGQMDHRPKQRIIRQMSEINRRANNAVQLTEVYQAEAYSRFRWAQLSGVDLCSATVTGIPGTERLGMNWAQLTWRALNYYEDMHDQSERDWENAKFVGSCMIGSKGLAKVYQQDNDRRQKEKEERLARKDRLLRQVLLGEQTAEHSKQLQGAVVTGAHTVEELAKQLEGDLRGEKDWHDQVVEAHTARIKQNMQTRQDQLHQMSKKHEEEFGGKKLIGGTTDFTGLSIEEVQERILRRKQLEAQQASRRMVRPEAAQVLADPKSREFMDKWGITEPGVGFSVEQTNKDPSAAVPIAPPRQGGTPFRRR